VNVELIIIICQVAGNIIHRIANMLSNVWGWVGSAFIFAMTYIVGWFGDTRTSCLYLILIAVGLDLLWGMASSHKRKTFALSVGFTKTAIKFAIYLSILMVVAAAEKAISDNWCILFRATSAVLICAEGISICGHILIIKPDTPVIRLLWKVLRSEIAKKTGVRVEDVEEFYNNLIQNRNDS